MSRLILFVHAGAGSVGRKLEKTVRDRFPDIEQEYCDSEDAFCECLCRPIHSSDHEIHVALADTHERLDRLIGLKPLLEGRRLILILPENRKDVFSRGHQLLPRYVSSDRENFDDVVSVLGKMTGCEKSPGQFEKQEDCATLT